MVDSSRPIRVNVSIIATLLKDHKFRIPGSDDVHVLRRDDGCCQAFYRLQIYYLKSESIYTIVM